MYNIAGWDLFSYLLADDPGLLSEWFEELNQHEIQRVHLIADKTISPVVMVYCDIASNLGPIFSPDFLNTEFFPRLSKLIEAWHDHGIKVIYHSEGDLKPIMDNLVKCEIDGINPCEKRNMSIEYVRSHYPKLIIWGGIDSFELLPRGTPEDVKREVKEAINVCKDGGFILGADGQIHPACKAQNVVTMFKAAREYQISK